LREADDNVQGAIDVDGLRSGHKDDLCGGGDKNK